MLQGLKLSFAKTQIHLLQLTMAEDKEISRIKQFLRSVLLPFKEGVAAENLLGKSLNLLKPSGL